MISHRGNIYIDVMGNAHLWPLVTIRLISSHYLIRSVYVFILLASSWASGGFMMINVNDFCLNVLLYIYIFFFCVV